MARESYYIMPIIADLHIHSNYSDGKFEINNIISKCIASNLDFFCISDHDTINHFSPIKSYINNHNHSINYIRGTEFTCEFNDSSIHILGYEFDENSQLIIELLKKINQERFDIIQKIGDRLIKQGCKIEYTQILENENSPGRPHLAKELIDKGYAKNFNEAFYKWLGRGKPAYLKKWKPSAKTVVDLIHKSNGHAFIAHVGLYKSFHDINDFLELNIDGIEVYHPHHSNSYSKKLLEYCIYNNLIYSGGSDYHGWQEKNNSIGTYGLDEKTFEQFYKKCLK
ncbi:MAG: hypothetical protein CMF96_05980 [Candidatus Marinimicrobia bacterium]|nr:hypothetical protein [Candidatus Neomarinimicrobiota bacterium]|tara:strand:+ start:348 stop:1193 length:846 start_codon:yes stop_codon:yes gene_type:complete